jgi:hypothetical protein
MEGQHTRNPTEKARTVTGYHRDDIIFGLDQLAPLLEKGLLGGTEVTIC